MSESTPVSVVIPTYNGEEFVSAAIDSVLAQTYANFELIIIDDGSTDSTVSVVRSYDDDRIVLVENDVNLGIARNMNRGAELANGDIIAFLDQDDYWRPKKLERHLELHDITDTAVVYSDIEIVNSKGETLEYAAPPSPEPPGKPLVRQLYIHLNYLRSFSCVTIERSAWQDAGGLDSSYSISADYDLYIRFAETYRFAYVDDRLAIKRKHEDNTSGDYFALYEDVQQILARTRNRHQDMDLTREEWAEHGFQRAFCAYRAGRPQEAITHCLRSLKNDVRSKTVFLFIILLLDRLSGPLQIGTMGYRLYRRSKGI